MRIVAGTLRGRSIVAPAGQATRPTTDRTREAMFNSLVSLGVLDGAVVADLFAGSGALGIEALSRGAKSCTFVESDAAALAAIRQNVRSLGLEERSRVVAGRVESALSSLVDVDVVLADPPYGYENWAGLLECLESVVHEDGILVIESGSRIEVGSIGPARDESPRHESSGKDPAVVAEKWSEIRSKRYGRTWVTFLQRN